MLATRCLVCASDEFLLRFDAFYICCAMAPALFDAHTCAIIAYAPRAYARAAIYATRVTASYAASALPLHDADDDDTLLTPPLIPVDDAAAAFAIAYFRRSDIMPFRCYAMPCC